MTDPKNMSDGDITKATGVTSPEGVAAIREGAEIMMVEMELAYGKVRNHDARQIGLETIRALLQVGVAGHKPVAEACIRLIEKMERHAFDEGFKAGACLAKTLVTERPHLLRDVSADPGHKERIAAEKQAG